MTLGIDGCSHWRRGAGIGRDVCNLFVTPMVYIQSCRVQREPLDTLLVIDLAEVFHSLIIDPDRRDKVAEDILGHGLVPRHLLVSLERMVVATCQHK